MNFQIIDNVEGYAALLAARVTKLGPELPWPVLQGCNDLSIRKWASRAGCSIEVSSPARNLASGKRFAEIVYELAQSVEHTNDDRQNSVVLALEGDFLLAAIGFAVGTGRKLEIFRNPEELWYRVSRAEGSITIVVPPEVLSPAALCRLAEASAIARVGLITGRTLSAATLAVAKAIVPCSCGLPSVIVSELEGNGAAPGGLTAKTFNQVDQEFIEHLLSSDFEVFGASTHGDNIDSDLGVGVICGSVPSTSLANLTHTCQLAGRCRRNIHETTRILPIGKISAELVFLETCSGASISGGMYPPTLSQALAVIEGAGGAFISSTKVMRGTQVGPVLVAAALKCGMSYGEVVLLYSNIQQAFTGDSPSYILLGDPDRRLAELSLEVSRAHWSLGDTSEIACGGQGRPLELFSIAVSSASRSDPPFQLLFVDDHSESSDHSIFAAVYRGPNGIWMAAIFSTCALPPLRLAITPALGRKASDQIGALEAGLTQLTWMYRKIANADGLRRTPELALQTEDLGAALTKGWAALDTLGGLGRLTNKPLVAMGDRTAINAALFEAHSAVRLMDRDLAKAAGRWKLPHHVAAFYCGSFAQDGPERRVGTCPHCANPLYELDVGALIRCDIKRVLTHCAKCAVISDRPSHMPMLWLAGDRILRSGQSSTQIVMGLSDMPFPSLALSVAGDGGVPWLQVECHPSVTVLESFAGGPLEVSINVSEVTLPGIYYIMLFAFSGAAMAVSSKVIEVPL